MAFLGGAPEIDIHACIDSFLHNLKLLTHDLVVRCPQDPTIYRAERRIMTGIDIDPLFVTRTVGEYLLDYRDQIYSDNIAEIERFFLANSFDRELQASVDMEKADLVAYIIPKAKQIAVSISAEDKKEYIALIRDMLDAYIEYLAATTLDN